jgi:hypothetical protein
MLVSTPATSMPSTSCGVCYYVTVNGCASPIGSGMVLRSSWLVSWLCFVQYISCFWLSLLRRIRHTLSLCSSMAWVRPGLNMSHVCILGAAELDVPRAVDLSCSIMWHPQVWGGSTVLKCVWWEYIYAVVAVSQSQVEYMHQRVRANG